MGVDVIHLKQTNQKNACRRCFAVLSALTFSLALCAVTPWASAQGKKTTENQSSPVQEKKSTFKTVTFPVEGMSCISCVAGIKKAVKSLVGVTDVEVNLQERNTKVSFTEGLTSADAIAKKIGELGYKVGSWTEVKK